MGKKGEDECSLFVAQRDLVNKNCGNNPLSVHSSGYCLPGLFNSDSVSVMHLCGGEHGLLVQAD